MISIEEFEAIASFGQYLHWSQMQYKHFRNYGEESDPADFLGALCHWLASLFVVTEGWCELSQKDDLISDLLVKYDDYYQLMRRLRNGVFHYQAKPLCEKLTDFLDQKKEGMPWAMALQFEFQRVLVNLVPEDEFGEEIKRTIGWWPKEFLVLKKAEYKSKHGELNRALTFLSRIAADL